MTSKAGNQTTRRTLRKALASLPILMVLLCLLSLALVRFSQDPKPGPVDVSHVQIVMAKQSVWLNKHPLLLKVSQINFAGIPGDFITNACWHLMKSVSGHRHPPNRIPKQTS